MIENVEIFKVEIEKIHKTERLRNCIWYYHTKLQNTAINKKKLEEFFAESSFKSFHIFITVLYCF